MNGKQRGFGGFGIGENRGYLGSDDGEVLDQSGGENGGVSYEELEAARKEAQRLGVAVIRAMARRGEDYSQDDLDSEVEDLIDASNKARARYEMLRKGFVPAPAPASGATSSMEPKSVQPLGRQGSVEEMVERAMSDPAATIDVNALMEAKRTGGRRQQVEPVPLRPEPVQLEPESTSMPTSKVKTAQGVAQEEPVDVESILEASSEQGRIDDIREDAEVEGILLGKDVWERYDQLTDEIDRIAKEIAGFRKYYMMDDQQKRELAEARAEMNEAIRKRNLLIDYAEKREIPEPEVEDGAGGDGAEDGNEGGDGSERAADLLNGPNERTQEAIDKAAIDRVVQLLGDEEIARRYQQILEQRAQVGAEAADESAGEVVPQGHEAMARAAHEKIKKRLGVRDKLKLATARAVVSLVTFFTLLGPASTANANSVMAERTVPYSSDLKVDESAAKAKRAELDFNGALRFFNERRAEEAAARAGLDKEEMGDVTETRGAGLNGSLSDYAPEYANFENKSGRFNYGTSKAEFYGDVDGALASWAEIGRNQPESQASYFAHLAQTEDGRKIWKECGIEFESTGDVFEDARRIDDIISNAPNGAEVQSKIDAKMAELLGNENTRKHVEFYQEYRREKTSYMLQIRDRGAGNYDPSDLELGYSEVQRNGQKQMRAELYTQDGVYLCTIDLNMECGFQINVELANGTVVALTPEGEVVPLVPMIESQSETVPNDPGDPGDKTPEKKKKTPEKEKDPGDEKNPGDKKDPKDEEDPEDGEDPEGKDPEGKDPEDKDPDPEDPEGEEIEKKNPENIQNVVNNTLENNQNIGQEDLDQTQQNGEVTSQPDVETGVDSGMTEQETNNFINSILQQQQNNIDEIVQQTQQEIQQQQADASVQEYSDGGAVQEQGDGDGGAAMSAETGADSGDVSAVQAEGGGAQTGGEEQEGQ